MSDLLEAIELGFLLDLAEVVVFSARNRAGPGKVVSFEYRIVGVVGRDHA